MITFKISRGNWSTYQSFNTIEEAQAWAFEKWGDDAIVSVSNDIVVTPPTPEQKLLFDKDFGSMLVEMFLLDNRMITPSVTPTESIELLSKFQSIEKLASLGDIKSVQVLLSAVQTDDRIFTQERKDKYMDLVNGYLQN